MKVEVDHIPPGEHDTPETTAILQEEIEQMRRALEKLTQHQRRIVLLRDYHGYTLQQIAAGMDANHRTVCRIYYKARKFIRAEMSKE
jgi:RNA polymerase sigma factor (sigma-70 family)